MGTGIGGGLIVDGRPFSGSRGAAEEIGHVVVAAGGALCSCGRRGCVEGYAGRRSMAGVASAMVEAGRSTVLFDIRDQEGKTKLTSKVWARALAEDDELAGDDRDVAVAADVPAYLEPAGPGEHRAQAHEVEVKLGHRTKTLLAGRSLVHAEALLRQRQPQHVPDPRVVLDQQDRAATRTQPASALAHGSGPRLPSASVHAHLHRPV